jgi:hypothetical protein
MPAAGPQAYGIDKDSEVVVLLYSRMRVVKNYTFKKDKLTDQDVDAIAAEFARLSPKRK